jgi:hypothetical protein
MNTSRTSASDRLAWVDNLRTLMIVLVVNQLYSAWGGAGLVGGDIDRAWRTADVLWGWVGTAGRTCGQSSVLAGHRRQGVQQ